MDNTVKVTINGQDYQVPKGSLLVEAAKSVGIEIPVFCYHPKMKPVGACRM
ncbi:MAG TPA: 2Fe-2S iron-sulfur cluster-binding protein, partial [Chloroflexota bacterium]|nr:2Fe-2S iron-sulfur cluster-binding protein [Chloroflexota bacterium]